jgi:hypothetical protein
MRTNKVVSFFTFGLFLIITGIISKLFDYSQSNLLMAIGLVFELLAALLFAWQKVNNK